MGKDTISTGHIKKYGVCLNDKCENYKQVREIFHGDLECPACKKKLSPCAPPKKKGPNKKLIGIIAGAVAAVAAIGGGAYAVLGGDKKPTEVKVVLNEHKKEIQVEERQSDTLKAEVTPADAELVWTSSKESALTVKDGIVKILSDGCDTVTVYVQAKTKDGEAKDSCVYILENQFGCDGDPVLIESFDVNKKSITLNKVGDTDVIACDPLPMYATEGYSYESSDERVATVSAKGVVTAKSPGNAVITVTCDCRKVKAEITVKVKEKGEGPKPLVRLPYGKYTGESKNGQMHGNGTIEFTSSHVIPGTSIMASRGEKVIGSFRDGKINMGTYYMNNGNQKIVKLGSHD